jgi:sulfoxide reductase heme-binding subunit YedZ
MNVILWYTSRATGIASMVLLTAVLALGMVTSGRRRPRGDSATVVMGMHRWLSLGMLSFLLVHIATAIAETYVSIDLISALVPFTSSYATIWVGLGTLAFDLLIAISATSFLRHRIKESTWKAVHWLSYAMWPIALVHGYALGTANQPILRWITVLCGVAGLGFAGWRVLASHHDRDRREAVLAQEWS